VPRAQTVTADDFRPLGRLIDEQQGAERKAIHDRIDSGETHNAIPKLSRRLSELLVALPPAQVVDLGSAIRRS
jgi:hypothetical protein